MEQQDGEHVYSATPKQRELHLSRTRFRAAIGGRGSGKSQFLLWEAVRYLSKYPGCHVLLLRKDFAELKKGLIHDLQADVPKDLYAYNASDHIATWFNGSKLYFGHCADLRIDDLNQYLSASFSFIGVEEGGEFPWAIWDFLLGSNRNKVAGPQPTMALATNPYGIGYGWIKQLFIEKKSVPQLEGSNSYDSADYFYNHSTVLDNPHLARKDPDYINRLNLLSPELKKKMLYGDLDSVSGQYFTNFSMERHVVKMADVSERIKWEDWNVSWLGSDYGLAHFWPTYWMRLALVKGWDGAWKRRCVVYDELISHDKSIAQYTNMIAQNNQSRKLQHVFFSPERFNRTDPEHTPAEQFTEELRKYEMPPCSRASNDRIAGATFLYSLFDADEIVILENCVNLIRAVPILTRDPDKLEDVLKADTLEDDCYDAFRYGAVSMLMATQKPAEAYMREHAARIDDPIAKHFYVAKRQQELSTQTAAFKNNVLPPWMSRQ